MLSIKLSAVTIAENIIIIALFVGRNYNTKKTILKAYMINKFFFNIINLNYLLVVLFFVLIMNGDGPPSGQ